MKASKQFATAHGQSHLPSQMVHVTAEGRRFIDGESKQPVVLLELERRSSAVPTYLQIRMTKDEARRLSKQLALLSEGLA